MRKRIIATILILLMACGVTGCGDQIKTKVIEELRERRIETKDFKNLTGKDKVYALEKMLNEHDTESICNLFSKQVKDEVGLDTLKSQAEDMFAYFGDGEFKLLYQSETEGVKNDHGVKDGKLNAYFDMYVDGEPYVGGFDMITVSSTSDDEIGMVDLQFVTEEWIDQEENVLHVNIGPGITICE